MDINYYEWIYLFFTEDEEAFSLLESYFRPTTLWTIHNRLHSTISECDVEEFEMEARLILLDCLLRYREDIGCTFRLFYLKCLDRKLITISKRNQFKKLESQYQIVNLDQNIKEDINRYAVEYVYTNRTQSAHDDAMLKIQTEETMNSMNEKFSSYEMSILAYKRVGYSTKEIAKMYRVPVRRIRYVLTKMKKWYDQIDK